MTEGAADRPVDAFVIEDEPMGDGRTIHYYVWPDAVEPDTAQRDAAPADTPGEGTPASADQGADV